MTRPDDLKEGLFGQVLLYVFEILPYLEKMNIFPEWKITSRLYGEAPDYVVIPGVFDLAYVPAAGPRRNVDLGELRARYCSVLGNEWERLNQLWSRYFAIPRAVLQQADAVEVGPETLGLHYRGTDKNSTSADTNSLSQEDFILLVTNFISRNPGFENIFLATDENSIVEKLANASPLPVVNLGPVAFHKDGNSAPNKAARALLDAVLLSRCGAVLKGASALSGFAKILNPALKIHRLSASKMFADIPYFPDAYIPPLTSDDPEVAELLKRQMKGDWLDDPQKKETFAAPFSFRERYSRSQSRYQQLRFRLCRICGLAP